MDDIDLRNWNRSPNAQQFRAVAIAGAAGAPTTTGALPTIDDEIRVGGANGTSGGGGLARHAVAQRFSPKRMGQVAKAVAVRARLEAERGGDELPAVVSANRSPGRNIVNTVVIQLRRLQAREREAIEAVRRHVCTRACPFVGEGHELFPTSSEVTP